MRTILPFFILFSLLFFQNCSKSGFYANDTYFTELSSTTLNDTQASFFESNSGKVEKLWLLADGTLVTPGIEINATSSGEVMLTWIAFGSPSYCKLLGHVVGPEGGPQIYKNLYDGDYEFVCIDSSGLSEAINFKIRRQTQAKKILTEKFPIDVFLVAGQSNAVGQSIGNQEFKPPTSRVLRYENGLLQDTNELGAWASFGRVYNSQTNRGIVFVSAAAGGTGSNIKSDSGNGHWGPEGLLYRNSITLLRQALGNLTAQGYQVQFSGVLWVQGENDAIKINQGVSSASDYRKGLSSIIQRYREDLGDQTPFFIFQTGTGVGESDRGYAVVRDIQRESESWSSYNLVVYDKAVTFPSRKLMWDIYHYKPAGYHEMGSEGAKNVVSFFSTISKAISPKFLIGSTAKNLQPLKNQSVLQANDYLKVEVSGVSLEKSGFESYTLKIHDLTNTEHAIEKGPYQESIQGTLSELGFIPGRTYSIEAKGCDAKNKCGPYSSAIVFSIAKLSNSYSYSWKTSDYGVCSARPYFSYGDWSACSADGKQTRSSQCVSTNGIKTRSVFCKNNQEQIVSESFCSSQEKPKTSEPCSEKCASAPMIIQSCQMSNASKCKAEILHGKNEYTLFDDVTVNIFVPSPYVAIGQRNTVYDLSGVLIAENTQVVEWGKSSAQLTFRSQDLRRYIEPLLQSRNSVKIVYELMKKSPSGTWESCKEYLDVTWSK